jgi:hypothetical protein
MSFYSLPLLWHLTWSHSSLSVVVELHQILPQPPGALLLLVRERQQL